MQTQHSFTSCDKWEVAIHWDSQRSFLKTRLTLNNTGNGDHRIENEQGDHSRKEEEQEAKLSGELIAQGLLRKNEQKN